MEKFAVRIELGGIPPASVYDTLHERLLAERLYKVIQGATGRWYTLPNATYVGESPHGAAWMRDQTLRVARAIWPSVDVIVVQYVDAAWSLEPVPQINVDWA